MEINEIRPFFVKAMEVLIHLAPDRPQNVDDATQY